MAVETTINVDMNQPSFKLDFRGPIWQDMRTPPIKSVSSTGWTTYVISHSPIPPGGPVQGAVRCWDFVNVNKNEQFRKTTFGTKWIIQCVGYHISPYGPIQWFCGKLSTQTSVFSGATFYM